MWEAYDDMDNEDFLWAGIPFMGGISGENKATCGAVSGAAVAIGLRHRCSLQNKEQAKAARNRARDFAGRLAKEFVQKYGHITCQELLKIDFSVPGAYQEFRNAGIAENKCYRYIDFIIEKLYAFEDELQK